MLNKKRKGLTVSIENAESTFKLYDTNILHMTYTTATLNSGGWKTNHTKNCINDNLPTGFSVYQKKGEWFIKTPNKVVDFIDGIVVELK